MEMITRAEKERLEQRLAALKTNRPVISQRIKEARELGDLRENGDYHAAREAQGMDEAEIRRLEERLHRAHVVEDSAGKGSDVVLLGSMVKLRDLDTKRQETVKLVGELSGADDEDVDEVTVSSPMGEALMKTRVGDKVSFDAPRGKKRYEVLEIN
jgi:transcription elongation factor GreA